MTLVEQFFESASKNRRIIHAIARQFKVEPSDLESDTLYRLMSCDHATLGGNVRTFARRAAIDMRRAARNRDASLSDVRQNDSGDSVLMFEPADLSTVPDAILEAREAWHGLTASERKAILSDDSDTATRQRRSRAGKKLRALMSQTR